MPDSPPRLMPHLHATETESPRTVQRRLLRDLSSGEMDRLDALYQFELSLVDHVFRGSFGTYPLGRELSLEDLVLAPQYQASIESQVLATHAKYVRPQALPAVVPFLPTGHPTEFAARSLSAVLFDPHLCVEPAHGGVLELRLRLGVKVFVSIEETDSSFQARTNDSRVGDLLEKLRYYWGGIGTDVGGTMPSPVAVGRELSLAERASETFALAVGTVSTPIQLEHGTYDDRVLRIVATRPPRSVPVVQDVAPELLQTKYGRTTLEKLIVGIVNDATLNKSFLSLPALTPFGEPKAWDTHLEYGSFQFEPKLEWRIIGSKPHLFVGLPSRVDAKIPQVDLAGQGNFGAVMTEALWTSVLRDGWNTSPTAQHSTITPVPLLDPSDGKTQVTGTAEIDFAWRQAEAIEIIPPPFGIGDAIIRIVTSYDYRIKELYDHHGKKIDNSGTATALFQSYSRRAVVDIDIGSTSSQVSSLSSQAKLHITEVARPLLAPFSVGVSYSALNGHLSFTSKIVSAQGTLILA